MPSDPQPSGSSPRYCPVCDARFDDGEHCPADGAVLIIETKVDPMIGQTLAQAYRIDERIGAGGMGWVYRGVQLSLDRPIAIKVMRPERDANHSMVRRFLREAKLSSRVEHPNIVRVIDGGNTQDGRCYLIMELLEGPTLEDYVPEDGLSYAEARELFFQLCAGVQALHDAGLIHRDLKPRNVILCPRGDEYRQLKILDFGLAKTLDPEVTGLTADGEFLGTPGYLAPEQMSNGAITVQTDVYALGALFYYMLCKRLAFPGSTGPELVMNQLADTIEELDASHAGAPPQIAALIHKALRSDASARFASVAAFAEAVAALDGSIARAGVSRAARSTKARPGLGPVSRRKLLLGAGAGLGLGAAGIGVWARRQASPIRLGMSGALTGTAGAIGQAMRLGLEARFALANDQRELPGVIELEVLDDGYEPQRAVANVEHFVAAETLALVANIGTPTTLASLPTLLEARLPLIGAHSGAEQLRRDPPDRYVFNFRAGYAHETAALVEHFITREQLAPRAIAVLAQDDDFGASGVDGIRRALADHGFHDFDQILVARYPANTMNVREAVAAVAARPQIERVVLVAAYRAAAQFVASVAPLRPTLGFAAISSCGGTVFVDELRRLGQDPTWILVTQIVPNPASAANGVLRYREALARLSPSAEPSVVSLEGFIVADLLVEALRRCEGRFEREHLVDTLETMTAVDLGFGTPISFSASDHQGSDRVWGARIDERGELVDFALS